MLVNESNYSPPDFFCLAIAIGQIYHFGWLDLMCVNDESEIAHRLQAW